MPTLPKTPATIFAWILAIIGTIGIGGSFADMYHTRSLVSYVQSPSLILMVFSLFIFSIGATILKLKGSTSYKVILAITSVLILIFFISTMFFGG